MNLFLDKIKSNTFPFIVAVTLLLGCSGAWYFFHLITSGLMGEREVNVICGDAQDYIADGDTVKGVFDNGTSGISKDLMAAFENLREIKDKMVALKDTFTTGSAGQRIDRISRKGTKIVKTANAMADESSAEVREALEKGRAALQKAKDLVEKLPDRSEESLKKAAEVGAYCFGQRSPNSRIRCDFERYRRLDFRYQEARPQIKYRYFLRVLAFCKKKDNLTRIM